MASSISAGSHDHDSKLQGEASNGKYSFTCLRAQDQESENPRKSEVENMAKPNIPVAPVRELHKRVNKMPEHAPVRQDNGELLVGLEPTTTRFQDLKIKM